MSECGVRLNILQRSRDIVMRSRCSDNVWFESFDGNTELLVDFVLLFYNKSAMTHKSTALVACPVHAILVNLSVRRNQSLIYSGRTLLGSVAVCYFQEGLGKEKARRMKKCQCIALYHRRWSRWRTA